MKKRFFQLVLTAVLSVSCVATGVNVSAAPLSSEGYSIEKVSHPERGAGETDGILSFDAMGEESNRNQSYVWSCVEHGNYIYLGTCWNPISGIYYRNLKNNLTKLFQNRGDENPAQKAGTMGCEEHKEMLFWTKEEYLKFADVMMDKPRSYYAFEMLYWCGVRMGELLALTPADFDFERQTVTINKSYQRLKGRDVITSPKTVKSNRTIKMPKFLCEEMQDYIRMLYDIDENERIFQITKSYLHHEMDRGAKAAGVKRIRIHDLRHSHISLLIEMGFSALAIADRVGHESIDITYRYAHLFPNKQTEMANRLDVERITDIVLTGNIEEEISVDQIKKDAEDAKEDAGYKG